MPSARPSPCWGFLLLFCKSVVQREPCKSPRLIISTLECTRFIRTFPVIRIYENTFMRVPQSIQTPLNIRSFKSPQRCSPTSFNRSICSWISCQPKQRAVGEPTSNPSSETAPLCVIISNPTPPGIPVISLPLRITSSDANSKHLVAPQRFQTPISCSKGLRSRV